MPKDRRKLPGDALIRGLTSLAAVGIVAAYVITTVVLFNRTESTNDLFNTTVEMLNMKVEMLQTEIQTIDLSMVPTEQTLLLESGTCGMNDDNNAAELINYNYYSYTIGNLTRYYAEFNGGMSGIPAGSFTSDPNCPGGTRTSRYKVNIFRCFTDPGRNSNVPSLINQGLTDTFRSVHQSFTVDEVSKITFSGGTDAVVTNTFSQTGPCLPRLYTVTSGGEFDGIPIIGPLYDSLVVTWYVWINGAGPFSISLNNVRVPIPQSFIIETK